jgi:hypothetical protein
LASASAARNSKQRVAISSQLMAVIASRRYALATLKARRERERAAEAAVARSAGYCC